MPIESSLGGTSLPSLAATRLPISRTCLVCVSFRKENDKQVPAGSQHHDKPERCFSVVAQAVTSSLMHFCGSHDVTHPGRGRRGPCHLHAVLLARIQLSAPESAAGCASCGRAWLK